MRVTTEDGLKLGVRGFEIVNGDVQVPQVVNEMTDSERCREPTAGQPDKAKLELVVVDHLQESADLADAPGSRPTPGTSGSASSDY